MKVIFSRKGFDQSAGGFPSLIFPDGTLFSIPIPSGPYNCTYSRLTFQYQGESIAGILNQVTNGKIRRSKQLQDCDYAGPDQGCHHDPMLFAESNRMVLGPGKKPEAHLRRQQTAAGDIFLFYGWFRKIARVNGRWAYVVGARDMHLIWAWMTVGSALRLDTAEQIAYALERFPELSAHPHLVGRWPPPNGVYVSREQARLPFSEGRCLTDIKDYAGRAKWRLPGCFNQPQAFTFLTSKIFSPEADEVIVRYRGYGQEFVLDLDRVRSSGEREHIMQHLNDIRIP